LNGKFGGETGMRKQLLASLTTLLTIAGLASAQANRNENAPSAPVTGAASGQPDQPSFLTQADNPEKAPAPAAPTPDFTSPTAIGSLEPAAPIGSGRIYAVSEATFFKPRFSGAANGTPGSEVIANVPILGPVPIPTTGTIDQGDFHHDGDWRGWIGFETASGFGFRTRYSQYRSTQSGSLNGSGETDIDLFGPFVFLALPATQTGTEETSLHMNVLDLDATYEFTAGNWSILGAVGARYAGLHRQASVNQTANITGIVSFLDIFSFPVGSGTETLVDNTSQSYEAWGPTLALELRRALSSGRLATALFCDLRGSQLSGESRLNQNSSSTNVENVIFFGPATISSSSSTLFSRPVTTTIGELEVGGEVGYLTRFGELFFRASYEWQRWNEGGSAIGSSAHGDALYLSGFTVGGGWRF
jgi:hypothetical protein